VKRFIAAIALIVSFYAPGAFAWQFEAGYGWQKTQDMGDGTWYQQGGPFSRTLNGKAYMAGVTGTLYESGPWSSHWHADYLYYGGLEAGCTCVPDAQYDPVRHVRTTNNPTLVQFHSSGHVQGIPLTLDLGYTYAGVRFAIEGGAWAYWPTWHTNALQEDHQWHDLSHVTAVQFDYVVGARIESGNTSLSYRYYRMKDLWNPNPGIATSTQMLMMVWKF